MPIKRPMNMTILPIDINGHTRNFFVDSGIPVSFSTNPSVTHIPAEYCGNRQSLQLHQQPPAVVHSLERLGGGTLSGFLGTSYIQTTSVRLCLAKNHLAFNDEPTWEPDFILPLRGWMVEIACDDGGNDGQSTWFIDTGSFLSYRWHDNPRPSHLCSPNWSFPSFQGNIRFDLYPNCTISHNNIKLATVTTARNFALNPGVAGMLGANFLVQFDAYFNRKTQELWLKNLHPSSLEVWENPSVEHKTPGFQFYCVLNEKTNHHKLSVSHHTHTHATLPVGTEFTLPNLDSTDPLFVNTAWKYLYSTEGTDVTVLVNGLEKKLPLQNMFVPVA